MYIHARGRGDAKCKHASGVPHTKSIDKTHIFFTYVTATITAPSPASAACHIFLALVLGSDELLRITVAKRRGGSGMRYT